MEPETLTLRCCCCEPATTLLPRADLEAGVAVCPRSGRLHRAVGATYALSGEAMPPVRRVEGPAARTVIRIDLSKEGYA